MIPKVGDKIKWRLDILDKGDRYNVVTKVEKCENPFLFSTDWHIWLDNGRWIRQNEVIAIVKPANNQNSMDITIEYKTPEKGYVEHKELDLDTEIKFIPDYEVLDEEETKELDDYFAKLNGFPCTYIEYYGKIAYAYDKFYDKYYDKCKDIKGDGVVTATDGKRTYTERFGWIHEPVFGIDVTDANRVEEVLDRLVSKCKSGKFGRLKDWFRKTFKNR